MSSPNVLANDEAARQAIRSALDTTMLVEAGAGSGKTTLMVDRLLAYLARGTAVEQLAAVTFTRKAANELRERLENQLERESRNERRSEIERTNLAQALRDRERMFVGTVHAFCGRILREHALDAGLPPDFAELDEMETNALRDAAYRDYIEHLAQDDSKTLTDVQGLGIDPLQLTDAFRKREQYRDIAFPAEASAKPSHTSVRDKLVALLERGFALRAGLNPEDRDKLQTVSDRLWRRYRTHNEWNDAADFARDVSVLLSDSATDITQKRWGDSAPVRKIAKAYEGDFKSFVEQSLRPWFSLWWAHAYPAVIKLFDAASNSALSARRHSGQLGFDDLLTETARLLRENENARRTIGERWRYLLVDEFQDTDPVQAEVCFLIASDPDQGNEWRKVAPRAGSLFVVGDPKQSIYRFRRADLAVYRQVQERIGLSGQVVHLTRNFRSVPEVGTLVNTHFANVFVDAASDSPAASYQAPFAEFVAASTRKATTPVIKHFWIGRQGRASNEDLVAEDAALVASWISQRCNVTRDRVPSDFLILTANKLELKEYAHQLAVRNIPVSATGVASTIGGVLRELLVIVRALADPANPVAVIAALEGWCVGCSHQDLWDARERHLEFRITHPPSDCVLVAGAGLQQLYEWWIASQQLSAASLLERVMDESGLFVLAASTELGDRSAGQLLQLVSLLRGVARTDLAAAMEAIERALSQDEDEPGLRVGRTDAVRLMNLHKAKGLEAPVVILAAPVPKTPRQPSVATWRDANGLAQGAIEVCDDSDTVIARPIAWEDVAANEQLREEAEHARLLYVAVTRAKEELVVSQRATYVLASKEVRNDTSRWSPLAAVLAMQSTELQLVATPVDGRRELDISEQVIAQEIQAARAKLDRSKRARYTLVSVTEAAKRDAARAEEDGASLAQEMHDAADATDGAVELQERVQRPAVDVKLFGTLAHAAMEGALRGRDDQQLLEYVRALVWHDGPSDAAEREAYVHAVMHAVSTARASSVWPTLVARGALAELNLASVSDPDSGGMRVLSEGIVDVAAFGDGPSLVVDWKFSGSSDARWATQLPSYQAQTEAYVKTLQRRTGVSGSAQIERVRVGKH